MHTEPVISKEQLAQSIATTYQIHATAFTFIPVGFAAACYAVESRQGRFFLKIWLAPESAQQHEQRQRTLRLLRAIADRDILAVAAPVVTCTASLSLPTVYSTIALFPWLDSDPSFLRLRDDLAYTGEYHDVGRVL